MHTYNILPAPPTHPIHSPIPSLPHSPLYIGVPRLKEIINAAEHISTPIIKATLVQQDSITSARIVKSKLETTTLGEIVCYVKEVHCTDQSYISIKLDMSCIQSFHLNINAYTVKQAILYSIGRSSILKLLKDKHVLITSNKGNYIHILLYTTLHYIYHLYFDDVTLT